MQIQKWPKFCVLDGSKLSFTKWIPTEAFSSETGQATIMRYLQCPAAGLVKPEIHISINFEQFCEYKND